MSCRDHLLKLKKNMADFYRECPPSHSRPRHRTTNLKSQVGLLLAGGVIKRRASRTDEPAPAFQLDEIQLCYFAALIHGLRLIDEKAAEKGVRLLQVDGDALLHYVRSKGDALVALYLADTGNRRPETGNHPRASHFKEAA